MTKCELAEAAQSCLRNIANETDIATYYNINEENADDAIADFESAVDDIAVYLGELRALLKEGE